jgi:hypothetical protein
MANQTLGVNIGSFNPYAITVTASGTLVGSDIELVINLSTVKSKQDVLLALLALTEFYQQSAGASQEQQGAAPP